MKIITHNNLNFFVSFKKYKSYATSITLTLRVRSRFRLLISVAILLNSNYFHCDLLTLKSIKWLVNRFRVVHAYYADWYNRLWYDKVSFTLRTPRYYHNRDIKEGLQRIIIISSYIFQSIVKNYIRIAQYHMHVNISMCLPKYPCIHGCTHGIIIEIIFGPKLHICYYRD